ncbi:MAG: hypothetical protein COA91_00590 [Robiginitomaculum sp.]|nr:MAG: hypothetical protein COA91_00590 [Robiginitomaculum sp.]
MTPEIIRALVALVVCICIGVLSYHLHAREHNKLNPRMIPWIIIAMACLATGFMLVVHLVNLLGVETGGRR